METELSVKTDSSSYNAGTRAAQLIHEEKSAVDNYHVLSTAFDNGRARDISDEPKHTDEPCIIIGSGGSLDLALPLLKDWKGGLICTTSHALSLVKFGAPPTHIFALDPFCTWDEIAGIDWSRYGTKLITTPTIWPTLIHNWPNEYLLYRQNMGRKDSFYASTLCHQYSRREGFRGATFTFMIRTELTLFAASPPAQLFASQVMGYGNIFLVGCDFGYTYGKDRFTRWTVKTPAKVIQAGNAEMEIPEEWEAHPSAYDDLSEETKSTSMMSMNGILTHPVHLYYKKNMLSAWRLSGQDIWTTDKGLITEMPYVDLEHVIAKQGKNIKGLSLIEKKRRAEEYLAMVGAFVIETSGGYSFIEAKNPEVDLVAYMRGINRQYFCPSCKIELTADGDTDVTGSDCPSCKAVGIIARKVYVDINGNMDRIKSRIEAAAKTRAAWEREHPALVPVEVIVSEEKNEEIPDSGDAGTSGAGNPG
jgi:Zn-finger nucleic acid-binding protein